MKVNISTVRGRAAGRGVPAPGGEAGPEAVVAAIAGRLRVRRQERALSLDALAARSGVSKGMLVQIERGATNPSIGTLCRVAAALGTSVADLVDAAPAAARDVVLAGPPRVLWNGPRGGHATLLVGSGGPDMLELWEWTLQPRERYDAAAHPAGTIELLRVRQGRLALAFGSTTYTVGAGQSATAFTGQPHAYLCAGARAVHFTMVVMEWHAPSGPADDHARAARVPDRTAGARAAARARGGRP